MPQGVAGDKAPVRQGMVTREVPRATFVSARDRSSVLGIACKEGAPSDGGAWFKIFLRNP